MFVSFPPSLSLSPQLTSKFLQGESLGGSDDVHQLHEDDKLKALLEEGGLRVAGV